MEQNHATKLYKILLAGPQKCGKTTLLQRYVQEKFVSNNYSPTIGVDFRVKSIVINQTTYKQQIWDAAGQQRFKALTKVYYKGAHIIFFVFDLSNRQSFEGVKKQMISVYQQGLTNQTCTAMLIGMKYDLQHERKVLYGQANQLGQSIGQYMEVSALTGFNVENVFLTALQYRIQLDQHSVAIGPKSFMSLMNSCYSSGKFKQFEDIKKQTVLTEQKKEQKSLSQTAAPGYTNNKLQQLKKSLQEMKNNTNHLLSQAEDFTKLKIILLGDAQVGKSAIFSMYSTQKFVDKYVATIGIQFSTKIINNLNQKNYKLQLWDTAGQQRFKVITRSYIKGTDIHFIVYDITNRKSFQRAKTEFDQIKKFATDKYSYTCLVGNKKDKQKDRQVQTEQGIKLAELHKVDFLEISAQVYEDVDNLFARALKHLLQNS